MTNLCYDAFKNIYIEESDELKVSACCLIPAISVVGDKLFQTKNLIEIRQQFLNNKRPAACQQCWKKESSNAISRRQGSNQWYKDNNLDNTQEELVRIDYWVGNTCNLKCVTCGPTYSSAWQQEIGITPTTKFHTNKYWQTLDLTNIKYIHFNGGEPLLSKTHIDFLQAIPIKSHVHITYNTNGTIMPSQLLLDLWAEFKLVQVDFSIDDIGTRFEYIRYPAVWDQVKDNLFKIKEYSPVNVMFAINTTISVLNVFTYSKLTNWVRENFNTNRVTDPVELRWQWAQGILNCQTMPLSSQHNIDQQLLEYVTFIDDDTILIPKLDFLTVLDARRGNSYTNAFSILNKYN